MIKKQIFIIFWFCILIVLFLFSFLFRDTNTAIVAQVEPMKNAISYHKAVRIHEIFVIPGQMVNPGDMLVRVERPDLVLDVEKKNNEMSRLRIEESLNEAKHINKIRQLKVSSESRIRKMDGEIGQLKMIIENNQKLSNQFGSLTGFADTVQQYGLSYYEIELDVLEKEKKYVLQQYELEIDAERKIREEEAKSYVMRESLLQKELEVLMMEETELIKAAEITGTIGNVNVQVGELLSPYTTIMSIYESKPTIIKAFMNEGLKYSMEVGKQVMVESTNRKYSIEGRVSEIGARIIEYPNRLKANQNIPMWGQELFIKIPDDNKFLNGERVVVIIKE